MASSITSNNTAANAAVNAANASNAKNTVSSTDKTSTDSTATTATNPNAKLDGQAFMTLLLKELEYQDPTSPMDTDKMLSQTSQLATLETQENTSKIMQELAAQLKAQSSSGLNSYAISSIGKMATLSNANLTVEDKTKELKVDAYIPEEATSAVITIKDSNNKVVKTANFKVSGRGTVTYTWDRKNDSGGRVDSGTYMVSAKYMTKDGKSKTASVNKFPVQAVKFESGNAMVKLGSKYYPISNVKEFSLV